MFKNDNVTRNIGRYEQNFSQKSSKETNKNRRCFDFTIRLLNEFLCKKRFTISRMNFFLNVNSVEIKREKENFVKKRKDEWQEKLENEDRSSVVCVW